MHIIIAGGGVIGAQLAQLLAESNNRVVVVEKNRARAAALGRQGLTVIFGDACRTAALESAGGLRSDVLVACTANDEENLVIAAIAKRHLEVPRVVARVNAEANRWLFDRAWGVDAAISSVSGLVGLIEEATGSARVLRLADLAGAGLTIVEINLTGESVAIGKTSGQLTLGTTDIVAVVLRSGEALAVDATLRFARGDSVLLVIQPDREAQVRSAFYPVP